MNTKLIIAAIACGLASAVAHAAGTHDTPTLAAVHAQAGSRLVVNCRGGRLPGYAALGSMLDNNNAGVLYATRLSMHGLVRRECKQGMRYVIFVASAATPRHALQIAAVGSP